MVNTLSPNKEAPLPFDALFNNNTTKTTESDKVTTTILNEKQEKLATIPTERTEKQDYKTAGQSPLKRHKYKVITAVLLIIAIIITIVVVTELNKPGYAKGKTALLYRISNFRLDDNYMQIATLSMLQKDDWNVKSISGGIDKELENGDVSMLVMPGSNLDTVTFFDSISQPEREAVRKWVQDGGLYLGICMGAFLAGSLYFDMVGNITQYDNKVVPRNPDSALVTWKGEERQMYMNDPPDFYTVETNNDTLLMSTFVSDNSPNMFVQKFGNGRLGLVAGHPEANSRWSTKDLYVTYDNHDMGSALMRELVNPTF